MALKIPFMQFESDPAFFTRFQREESIGKKLKHPYILRIMPVEDKSRPVHRDGVPRGPDAAERDAKRRDAARSKTP